MSTETDRPRRSGALVIGIVLLAGASVPAAWLLSFAVTAFAWRNTMREFPKQSWKVADIVQAVHDYRDRSGAWPDTLETVVPNRADELVREGWRYECYPPPDDMATLRLSGPLHMQLTYLFSSPALNSRDSGWSCSCEGDPVTVPPPPLAPEIP